MRNLQFLNHASYKCECDDFILLCDPWLEGSAFNDGWALLDNSTSNDELIEILSNSPKEIFIWYSHEHSDHFAIPFLKKLKSVRPDTKFYFQTTEDDRVVSFLRSNNFSVTVLKDGEISKLNNNSWISIQSWRSGDSFSLLYLDGYSILNLNDCIISSEVDCEKVKIFLDMLGIDSLDVLFTQFGYASWRGNEDDIELRKKEADEKLYRIATQINVLKPKDTILFASFVYFSNEYNFYLNDCQNTPLTVRASNDLKPYENNLHFMKPSDIVNLDENLSEYLALNSEAAEKHWQALYENCRPIFRENRLFELPQLIEKFYSYKNRVHSQFIGVFALIELTGVIKPLRIKIVDLNKVVSFSYLLKTKELDSKSQWDIEMYSSDLMFSISQDFGFDCTHVNGRFRASSDASNRKFLYFAGPQNMLKNGYGWKRPKATIKEFLRLAKR